MKSNVGIKLTTTQMKKYGIRIKTLIKTSKGKIKPEDVLEDARYRKSPLHDFFEWNNTVASEKWRIHQARMLLTQITEVVIIAGKEAKQRSFWNVYDKENDSGYVNLQTAISVPNYREQLIDKILNHLDNASIMLKMFKQYK